MGRAFLRDELLTARKRLHEQDDALRPSISANLRLRGRDTQKDEKNKLNDQAIGGMRNPNFSLAKVPGHIEVARKVSGILNAYLDAHPHRAKRPGVHRQEQG